MSNEAPVQMMTGAFLRFLFCQEILEYRDFHPQQRFRSSSKQRFGTVCIPGMPEQDDETSVGT
jgi:hypothetical protein